MYPGLRMLHTCVHARQNESWPKWKVGLRDCRRERGQARQDKSWPKWKVGLRDCRREWGHARENESWSEGSDTRRNLVHLQVKSLEILAEIRKSYLKSQSEILKLFEFPYFNAVNFCFLMIWGGVWAWPTQIDRSDCTCGHRRHTACNLVAGMQNWK